MLFISDLKMSSYYSLFNFIVEGILLVSFITYLHYISKALSKSKKFLSNRISILTVFIHCSSTIVNSRGHGESLNLVIFRFVFYKSLEIRRFTLGHTSFFVHLFYHTFFCLSHSLFPLSAFPSFSLSLS